MTQTERAPSALFRGYDSIARGMLDQIAVVGEFDPSDGARTVVNIRVCETLSELSKALEIDSSLSVGYLKAVNVTAKMKFMQELDVTSRSLTIVIYANHEIGTWRARSVRLAAPDVVAPPNDREAAKFVDLYGDSYVSAVTRGSEYYAVYTFHTETEAEQRSLKGELKVKGIVSGVSAGLKVQGELSEFLDKTSTNWSFDQEVTGHRNPKLPTKDKAIEFALAFPSKEPDSPVTTGISVKGYEGVKGMTREQFATIVANRTHFLGDGGALHSLARLNALQNQITWLRNIYDRYDFKGDPKLLQFEKDVKADLAKVNRQVAAWTTNAAGKFEPLDLPSLAKGEPVLDYSPGQSPLYGGSGGGPFDFMPVGDALRNQVRMTSIRLAEIGSRVRRIEVGYASDKATWTAIDGGREGSPKEILHFKENQFPVRFEVRHGASIDRLAVHLDDGRSTWAGGDSGVPVEWRVPSGAKVLGLSGRAGAVIDQLSIVYGTLQPAIFKETR